MLILGILVKVVGGIDGKEDHSFPDTPLVVHPHLGLEFQLGNN